MKRKKQLLFLGGLVLLIAFGLWTTALSFVDVQTIGPRNSAVGFAALNRFFHSLTGVHMALYTVTDWLGLVPIAFALGFALLGLAQWIQRKRFLLVDRSLLALGGFYIGVMTVYFLFERLVINYRPVLISGFLEASYPSSTTMLVLCVMPTAMLQLNARMQCRWLRKLVLGTIAGFTLFMVLGRLLSGVHWLTDIVGGILLSGGLVALYASASMSCAEK